MEKQGKIVEYLLKVLVVGDLGVGKTSLIQRYVHNIFSREYKPTLGVDFANKLIPLAEDKVVRLQLWDIAGQERYRKMTRVYYKEAFGAIIVFDLSRPGTLDSVQKWKADIDSKVRLPDVNQSPIPVILMANKCDMIKNGINGEHLDQYCRANGIVKWFETSAAEGINVDDGINFLVQFILEADVGEDDSERKEDADAAIDVDDPEEPKKENCC